jgi:glycosyltransferase involved in cell wall biosynthesis
MLPISIIIPCYNAAATLARMLDSCVTQPEAGQIIVVDDGSTDDSIGIVRRYRERDARIGLLQMPVNGGAAWARNWAAMHATQPLLAFIDADDEYFPGALAAARASSFAGRSMRRLAAFRWTTFSAATAAKTARFRGRCASCSATGA